MKPALPFLIVLAVGCYGQTTGPATTSGTCSPAVSGSNNTFTITCSGITPDQAKLLANIPTLLNNILRAGKESTAEILSRLEGCIVVFRSISPEQKQRIVAALGKLPGKPEIRIRATNSTAESSRYANQLRDAFAATPGWTAPAVFENMVVGVQPPVGLIAIVHNNKNIYGIAIQELFKELNIKVDFLLDENLPPNVLVMIVGQKPID
jgi:hypothetical protein